jgi:hypothetical protein
VTGAAENPAPPRNPWPRRVFHAVGALFWMAIAAAGLELFATFRDHANMRLARQVEANLFTAEAGAPDEAVVRGYAPDSPAVGRDFEARGAFFALNEAGRAEHASARGEVVALCRPDGAVERLWTPPQETAAPEITAFGRSLKTAAPLFDALPPDASGDARGAFAEALSGGRPLREYPIPQPGGAPPYVMQFAWQAAPDKSGAAVFVRPSMWKRLWQELRPGTRQCDAMDLRVNARGFRDDEVTLPKPAGVYRIVCVGGSTTAEGRSGALTYPNMVEAKFARAAGAGRVDVVNAGIFALTSYGEVEHLADYLALEPDLVVHYNFVNDVPAVTGRWVDAGLVSNRVRTLLLRSRFVYDYLNPLLMPNNRAIDRAIDETVLANLARLADACRDKGADLAVCTFAAPDYASLDRAQRAFFDARMNNMLWGRLINMASYLRLLDRYNDRVRAFCAERGLRVIPVAESLHGGTECFTDICHLRPGGIERKAQIVFDALRETVEKGLEAKK